MRAAADDLASVPDGSDDIATTRSVLIYAADRAGAVAEFMRVLRARRPGVAVRADQQLRDG